MPTQKQLKEILYYDPETGVFTWRVNRGGGARAGDVAGYLHREGYIRIGFSGKVYRAHRLAWLYVHGKWPKYEIDHMNRIRDDNRIVNLREASHADNSHNLGLSSKNTSGVSGISWYKYTKEWCAQIKVKGETIFLGAFPTKREAIKSRKAAEKKYGFHQNHGLSDETMEMLYGPPTKIK